MCDPAVSFAVASLAISAAGEGLTLAGQGQQAKAQAQYQDQLTKANLRSASEQAGQVRLEQAQQSEAAAREIERARQASQRARSTATVVAAEGGVEGNSVDAMLAEYGVHLGQFKEATLRQQSWGVQQSDTNIEAILAGARNQALNINAPISGPNYAAAGVRLAGSALKIRRDYTADSKSKP